MVRRAAFCTVAEQILLLVITLTVLSGERMRVERGIYMVSDSRLNIAGLNVDTVPILARAIIEAGV